MTVDIDDVDPSCLIGTSEMGIDEMEVSVGRVDAGIKNDFVMHYYLVKQG